jgi:hypothetical protein
MAKDNETQESKARKYYPHWPKRYYTIEEL